MALTQSKVSSAGGATSLAISFDSLPAVGARIVVAVAVWPQSQGDNLTCSDNQGHTYTSRWGIVTTGNVNAYAAFDTVVATSSGTFTVTVAGLESASDVSVVIVELSGAGSFEEAVADATSSSSSNPSKSITTDGASREVIGIMTNDWANSPADVTEGGGFTLVREQTNNSTASALYVAYKSVATAGTETLSYTFNDSGSHLALIGLIAYYSASGPGPSSDSATATDSASLTVTLASSDSAAETDAGSTPNTPIDGNETIAATDIARLHAQTAPRAYVVTQAVASGTTGPVTITAPAADDGDLLLIHVHQRGSNTTLSISGAGGQTWTAGTKRTQSTTNTSQLFWAKKTGTLTNVTVAGSTSASLSMIARMVVIRGNHADLAAILDLAESGAGFAAPSTPFDVTATGQTTISPGALTLVFFGSQDDNQWLVQTAGWTAVAAVTQNTGGNDNAEYAIYKEMQTPGATGNVVARQNTVGGDAGTYHVFTVRPAQIALDVAIAWDEASLTIESGSNVDASDTAAATDAGSLAAAPAAADTASASDASLVNHEQTGSDTAAVTDAGNNIAAAASSSDTAAAADAGAQPAVAIPAQDSAAASDAASIARNDTAADSAAATDAGQGPAVAFPGSEAISASDSGAISAAVPAQDSASGAIDASAVSVAMQGSESATAADSAALAVAIAGTDAGSVDDESAADQGGPTNVSSSDSAAATDSASVTAATIEASDSIAFSETSTTGTPLASSDSAAAADAGMVDKSLLAGDAAATSEAGVQLDIAAESPFDDGDASDAAAVAAALQASDSAAASEAESIVSTLAGSDTAAATDAGSLAVTLAGSDSAAAADASNADKGAASLFSDNFNSGNTSAWTGELVAGAGSLVEVVAGSANEGGYGLRSYKPNGANNGYAGVYKTGISSGSGIWSIRCKFRINSASYGGGLWLLLAEHPTNGRAFNVHHWNDDGLGWRMAIRNRDGTEASILIGALATNTWFDLEALYDETGAQPISRVYLDGVLQGSHTDTSSGGNALTPSNLYLRPYEQSWTNSWDISFDQVVVADGFQQSDTNANKSALDSAAAADSATIARQDASSDSAAADESASLAVTLASSDSAAAADASAEPTTTGEEFTTADSAAAEDASAPEVAFAGSDSAAATEGASLQAQIFALDDPDAEDASAVSVALSSNDSATGNDNSAFGTPVLDFDAGFTSEAGSLAVQLASNDSAAATDTGAVPTFVLASDSAAASETGSLVVTMVGAEVGSATDTSVPAAALASTDAGAGSDASAPAAALASADTAAGADASVLAAILAGIDVAAVVDAAAPGAALVAFALASDSAAAADVMADLFQGASGYDHKLTGLVLPAAGMAGQALPAAYLVALILPAAVLQAVIVNSDDVED